MSNDLSVLRRFDALREKVLRWERIAGNYILDAAEIPIDAHHGSGRDAFLPAFASRFGFSPPDVGPAEWASAEVFREEARQSIANALAGGGEIGHSRWDVPPADAEAIADEFLRLFGSDGRFFCNGTPVGNAQILAPYARPDFDDYIFGGGCVAVDAKLAAVLWVLDND